MAKNVICKSCGHVGRPKRITPGSILIEIVLWLAMIVPGLLYSLWRMNRRRDGCQACKSTDVVDVNSPIGQKLANDLAKA